MPIILKSSFLLTFHTCLVGSHSFLKRPLLFIVLYPPWSSNQIGWVFLLNPLISNTVCWWILSLHIRNSPEPQTFTIHPQYLQLFRSNQNPSSGLTTYALLSAPCSKQWPPPPAHTPWTSPSPSPLPHRTSQICPVTTLAQTTLVSCLLYVNNLLTSLFLALWPSFQSFLLFQLGNLSKRENLVVTLPYNFSRTPLCSSDTFTPIQWFMRSCIAQSFFTFCSWSISTD